MAVHKAVKTSLIKGAPAWCADPAKSSIHIMTKAQMDALPTKAVQAIFSTQHIVIPDQFVPHMAFNEKGLKTLADLNKPVTIHGPCFLMIFYCPSH